MRHQPGRPQTLEHRSQWSKQETGRQAAGRGMPALLHTEQSCATLLEKQTKTKVELLSSHSSVIKSTFMIIYQNQMLM